MRLVHQLAKFVGAKTIDRLENPAIFSDDMAGPSLQRLWQLLGSRKFGHIPERLHAEQTRRLLAFGASLVVLATRQCPCDA